MLFKTLTLLILIAIAGVAPAKEAQTDSSAPVRIAVVAMTSNVDGASPEFLESAITEALVSNGRLDAVARTKINAVLAEQAVNNSDLVDPKRAIAVGRLLGANYLVTGTILSATFEPGFFSKDQFRMRAHVQVIEVETGRILIAENLLGVRDKLVMARGATLGQLSKTERERSLTETATSIARQLVDRINLLNPLLGYIVKVSGNRVAINLGRASGIKPGQEYLVVEEGDAVRDPVTGEMLSVERRTLARLVVTDVESKLSWTRVLITYSPSATVPIGGDVADLQPPKGFLTEKMSVMQTESRAAEIRRELDKARRARKR